ncbi:MAG TPA: AbrB/MazE/SpoVT family DNA-binding domain-containing protein, partial [Candidatus Nanoarchaeia archaeon]|nr:AbrB/MazE/SpoVT family DNA-binding domain-containing protein [Candidatus Nanoarchaeia archaeon]
MKRKIVKLGRSTLVVSLPKKWTEQYGVNAGDELELEEHGKQLSISTQKDKSVAKVKIDIAALAPAHNYALLALYLRGAEEIEVTSAKPELIARLPTHPINQLSGFEIVEQSKHHALVKDVSGTKELDLNTLFRRVWLLVL